jgi:hypothetical protein
MLAPLLQLPNGGGGLDGAPPSSLLLAPPSPPAEDWHSPLWQARRLTMECSVGPNCKRQDEKDGKNKRPRLNSAPVQASLEKSLSSSYAHHPGTHLSPLYTERRLQPASQQ